jgi:hypothetical protein
MDWFFDKFGRDMVIADWLKRNKPDYVKLYQHILAKNATGYAELNQLILLAFETGISFARASERDPRVDVATIKPDYEREDD